MHTCTLSLPLSLSLSHTHTHTHTHTLSLSHTLHIALNVKHTHTHSLSLSHTHNECYRKCYWAGGGMVVCSRQPNSAEEMGEWGAGWQEVRGWVGYGQQQGGMVGGGGGVAPDRVSKATQRKLLWDSVECIWASPAAVTCFAVLQQQNQL